MVKERFGAEHAIGLLVAVGVCAATLLSAVALLVAKCRRRRINVDAANKTMIRARSGGDISCSDSVNTQVGTSNGTHSAWLDHVC